MGNQQDVHLSGGSIDPVDDAPVTEPIAQLSGEFAGEAFDVVVAARITLSCAKHRASLRASGWSAWA